MKRRVELYGRLKDAGRGAAVEIDARPGATAGEVLAAVGAALGDPRWVAGVALATEAEVLAPGAVVPEGARMAALPPVCGG